MREDKREEGSSLTARYIREILEDGPLHPDCCHHKRQ